MSDRVLCRAGWMLWPLAPVILFLGLYRPASTGGRAARIPGELGAWRTLAEHPLGPQEHNLLGTDDAVWRTYEGADGQPVYLVAVFHDSNWKSVHPPHICLEGTNMDIVRDDAEALDLGARSVELGRLLCRSRDSGRSYLSYYVYAARDFTSSTYSGFVLHHLLPALLRTADSGFLMRVETWVGEAGEADARARCQAFLADFLPVAEALVR